MLSFTLPDDFINTYADKKIDWGYTDAGGSSLGEITFLRTYSRLKDDGTKERWHEVCRRVIEGMYSIQKDHCKTNRLPWNDHKAQRSARDAYDRLFTFKWTPPGRGLWVMGTPLVNEQRNSAALQNCAYVSTADMTKTDPAGPFCFLMEASMLGVGVGFDDKGADKGFTIHSPDTSDAKIWAYEIPDTREGWVESVKVLIESYLIPGKGYVFFDYDLIRPEGEPIKTFGGTAAGPEPLRKLHRKLRHLFAGRSGQLLTRTDIADIGNLIGVCVVSGNVRRSAELLIGHIDDKDFIDLKNHDVNPQRDEWSWMSNNSVEAKVGDNYAHLVDGIALNGEPGVIWMDTTRAYGRLIDPPNNKDWRAAGYNPSLVPGTLVYTTDGIIPIEQLDGRDFKVKNIEGQISAAYCWQSGKDKPIYNVNLAGGWSYGATQEHKWPVWDGAKWVKKTTLDLNPGDQLPNLRQDALFSGSEGTYDEGFLIGWNLGDGWQTIRKDGRRQFGFMVSASDRAHGIHIRLVKALAAVGVHTDFDGKDEINVSANGLGQLFDRFGVQHKTQGLPRAVWDANVSDEFRRGLLDALFSADGTVGDYRISFSQASEVLVDEVASLLGFFGVKSHKQIITRPRHEAFPRTYSDDGSTFTRYVIRIGSIGNVRHFMRIVNFSRLDKQDKMAAIAGRESNHADRSGFISVTSVTPAGTSDVWDVTVYDDTHAFQIDHCVTGNCAEQSLESFEMCTLVECYLNRHDSLEDFQQTLKYAFMYAKTVTLLPTHWKRTNAIMQRNRRIGCSVSGIANFADNRGMTALRTWLNDGYSTVQQYDRVYSEWLCVRESIKTTTVKPSGTVSILAGESPGVHWAPGGQYFNRAIRFSKDDPMVELFRQAGYTVEPDVKNSDTTVVAYFPIQSLARRAESDVSLFEKANLAVIAQRYWSDNSVSVTLSFNPETEAEHVGTVLHMHEGQLKTVSFLPSGNSVYPQMPYTSISAQDYDDATMRLFKVDLSPIYDGLGLDAVGEKFCTTDVCEIKEVKLNA